mmetsp:Transcript_13928/g.36120  ORF Transcript_13928/g.36120 Transcript_13928/m.36120 type:complete len:202 (+) Transcript_13928:732-1337(+)
MPERITHARPPTNPARHAIVASATSAPLPTPSAIIPRSACQLSRTNVTLAASSTTAKPTASSVRASMPASRQSPMAVSTSTMYVSRYWLSAPHVTYAHAHSEIPVRWRPMSARPSVRTDRMRARAPRARTSACDGAGCRTRASRASDMDAAPSSAHAATATRGATPRRSSLAHNALAIPGAISQLSENEATMASVCRRPSA